MNTIIQLDAIIERLQDELVKYTNRSDANDFFINKQNQLIKELIDIYNSYEVLKFIEIWVDVERIINNLEIQDPELSAHQITIKTKPKGNNTSLIIINPFTK